jgi:glycogen operon protein
MWLNGATLDEVNVVGEPVTDDSFLLLFNPHHESVRFVLPKLTEGKVWEVCFDTKNAASAKRSAPVRKLYNLIDRSMAALQEVPANFGAAPMGRP